MKTRINRVMAACMALFVLLFINACSKIKTADRVEQMDLQNNVSFKNYVARSIVRQAALIQYTGSSLVKSQRITSFRNSLVVVKEEEPQKAEAVLADYSVAVDPYKKTWLADLADQVRLLEKIPALQSLTTTELQLTLSNNYRVVAKSLVERAEKSLTKKLNAERSKTQQAIIHKEVNHAGAPSSFEGPADFGTLYSEVPSDLNEEEVGALVESGLYGLCTANDGLTVSEVLDCAKEAFLAFIGAGAILVTINSVIAIKGLGEGIKLIGEFAIKHASWITAALVAADVAICLYQKAHN